MKLSKLTHIATRTPSTGWVRKYRKNPGDQELAVRAAIQTARKLEKSVVVIKGNSHMNVVYHIANTEESLRKYLPGVHNARVLLVRTTGEIFQAEAE